MSVSCRQKGLVLSVDDYVPAVYSAFYNRKEQGIVADYVIAWDMMSILQEEMQVPLLPFPMWKMVLPAHLRKFQRKN